MQQLFRSKSYLILAQTEVCFRFRPPYGFALSDLGYVLRDHGTSSWYNNNNNNNHTIFMVLSSWQSHCESSPGSFDECRMAPSGRRPKTKPDDLGCESACTGCQKLHPPSPYVHSVRDVLQCVMMMI